MDENKLSIHQKIADWFRGLGKAKYAVFAVIAGLFFLSLPSGTERGEVASVMNEATIEDDTFTTEEQMGNILSQVDGAGSVQVMLTKKNTGVTEYQTNRETTSDGDREELRTETVFGEDDALVRCQTTPEYLGALVVSQGADRPEVCLNLVRAVESLTGLSSDKITVLKMKR